VRLRITCGDGHEISGPRDVSAVPRAAAVSPR
jgi:hypothetical protein